MMQTAKQGDLSEQQSGKKCFLFLSLSLYIPTGLSTLRTEGGGGDSLADDC